MEKDSWRDHKRNLGIVKAYLRNAENRLFKITDNQILMQGEPFSTKAFSAFEDIKNALCAIYQDNEDISTVSIYVDLAARRVESLVSVECPAMDNLYREYIRDTAGVLCFAYEHCRRIEEEEKNE